MAQSVQPKARRRNRRPPRATMVKLVMAARGRHRTIGVRSVRTGRVFFECSATDARGAELAVLTAERYCAERGFVLVMAANDTARAASAAA